MRVTDSEFNTCLSVTSRWQRTPPTPTSVCRTSSPFSMYICRRASRTPLLAVTAAADSTPMLVFAGNTQSYHHAREPHQGIRFHADASQGDIYRPFCKRVWRVDDVSLLPDVMPRALNIAQTGRPGAVLIDVPM